MMKDWLRFMDWPLRAKMAALLVAASIVPLAAAAWLDIREARARVTETTSALLTARGDELAAEIDAFHERYQSSSFRFAHLPALIRFCEGGYAESLKADALATLAVHPLSDPAVRGLAVLDPRGVVRVATETVLTGKDLSYRPYVRAALAGQRVTSDLYFAQPEVGLIPTVAYAMPVRGAGERLVGVVVFWVRATAIWKIMGDSNGLVGASSFAVLFDHAGIRIGHSYNPDIVFHPGERLDPGLVEQLSAEQRFGADTRKLLEDVRSFPEQFARSRAEVTRRELFHGYAPVNRTWNFGVARRFHTVPWTVFYMVPDEVLNAQIVSVTRNRLWLAAAIMLLALAAGVLFSVVILRPIGALSGATEALASGDLTTRLRLSRRDELGALASSFDSMAGRIETQAEALKSANEELEARVQVRTAELVATTDALKESEQSLATTLNSIGDAVIATDTEGKVVRMNPVAEALTGWRLEDARSKPLVEVFHIVNEDTRRVVESPAVRVLREGVVVGLANHTALLSRDGSERPIADSGAPIRDPMGNVTGVVLVFRDQTEERRLASLETQNRQIQEASRLKSEFLANMSHELRTPLNSVIGFAELLHDGEVGPLEPKQQEFLGDILSSGRHLLQLINDVLDLSKVEAGKMDFHPESIDLDRTIHEVCSILRTAAANRGIRLEVAASPQLGEIVLDAARLKQILYNYLSNALKFTSSGGSVVVRAMPAAADTFRVEVTDTGIGIAPPDIQRLFTEFQQLDAGAAKRHGGTGLGLALTKRLAEAQGGRVGVESVLGRGSTFFVVLPRVLASTGPSIAADFASVERPGAPRVLVVDDSAADREVIASTLSVAGYAVEVAGTGAAAIARCAEQTFDAITLDLILPDMSGLDVLRSIRATGKNREAPVVVLTVVTEKATAGFAVHDVLAKPLDGPLLLSSLERLGIRPDSAGRVWVIDDDPGSLKLMGTALEQLGYRPTCFSDAAEALAAVQAERPEAVVLDLMMPVVDGFQFLARFRALREGAATPVLVWTIKDLSRDELEQLRASAQAVIQKGAGAAELSRALSSFLQVAPKEDQPDVR